MNSKYFFTIPYLIEYSVHFFYIENDAEIFPLHYTQKVAEKGFKMAFMMNKIAMINTCEIIPEKIKIFFFAKYHCEIWVRTILTCPLYSIKYGNYSNIVKMIMQ